MTRICRPGALGAFGASRAERPSSCPWRLPALRVRGAMTIFEDGPGAMPQQWQRAAASECAALSVVASLDRESSRLSGRGNDPPTSGAQARCYAALSLVTAFCPVRASDLRSSALHQKEGENKKIDLDKYFLVTNKKRPRCRAGAHLAAHPYIQRAATALEGRRWLGKAGSLVPPPKRLWSWIRCQIADGRGRR